jgi:hypothetical protein
MDRIDLPAVGADANLNDVITLMKAKGRSGVVVELPSGPRVIEIDIVLHTLRKEGNLKIGAVRPRLATMSLPGNRTAESVLVTADELMDTQDLMDDERAAYAVARVVGGVAEIITRHEPYANMLGSTPSIWRCKKNPNHVWLTYELWQPGDKCRNDRSAVDPV